MATLELPTELRDGTPTKIGRGRRSRNGILEGMDDKEEEVIMREQKMTLAIMKVSGAENM